MVFAKHGELKMLYANHVPVCPQSVWISSWFNKTFFFLKLVDLIKLVTDSLEKKRKKISIKR